MNNEEDDTITHFRYKFEMPKDLMLAPRRPYYPSNTQIQIAMVQSQLLVHDVVCYPGKYRHPFKYRAWKKERKQLLDHLLLLVRKHNTEIEQRRNEP